MRRFLLPLLFALVSYAGVCAAAPPRALSWGALYNARKAAVVRVRCGIERGAGILVLDRFTLLTSSSIAGCGRTVWVQLRPGQEEQPAVLKKTSPGHDLALLRLSKPLPAEPFRLRAKPVKRGEEVALIGHPYLDRGPLSRRTRKLLPWSLTRGLVGQRSRHTLQVSAPLMGGFVGAPVLDREGQLLGMLSDSSPWGQPVGKAIRAEVIRHFLKPSTKPAHWPYFAYEVLLEARFSYPLFNNAVSALPVSTQELRLDLIFADQWVVGFVVGLDLLSLSDDFSLSLVSSVNLEYRWLLPARVRPVIDYLGLEVGVLASQIEVNTKLESLDLQKLSEVVQIRQRFSLWVGLRLYAFLGKFSIGFFFDPAQPTAPVFSVAWAFVTKQ